MRDSNPFQPPHDSAERIPLIAIQQSAGRWALIGFVLGVSLPVAYGLYRMHRYHVYIASLALGESACGTGALGSLGMTFVIAPICGLVGAAIACCCVHLVSRIVNSRTIKVLPSSKHDAHVKD